MQNYTPNKKSKPVLGGKPAPTRAQVSDDVDDALKGLGVDPKKIKKPTRTTTGKTTEENGKDIDDLLKKL